jgi:hypothetical protein
MTDPDISSTAQEIFHRQWSRCPMQFEFDEYKRLRNCRDPRERQTDIQVIEDWINVEARFQNAHILGKIQTSEDTNALITEINFPLEFRREIELT